MGYPAGFFGEFTKGGIDRRLVALHVSHHRLPGSCHGVGRPFHLKKLGLRMTRLTVVVPKHVHVDDVRADSWARHKIEYIRSDRRKERGPGQMRD